MNRITGPSEHFKRIIKHYAALNTELSNEKGNSILKMVAESNNLKTHTPKCYLRTRFSASAVKLINSYLDCFPAYFEAYFMNNPSIRVWVGWKCIQTVFIRSYLWSACDAGYLLPSSHSHGMLLKLASSCMESCTNDLISFRVFEKYRFWEYRKSSVKEHIEDLELQFKGKDIYEGYLITNWSVVEKEDAHFSSVSGRSQCKSKKKVKQYEGLLETSKKNVLKIIIAF